MNKQDLNWRIDNIIPFILIIGSFFVYLVRLSVVETKLDMVIQGQRELTQEFREWKTQSETRLGTVESKQNQVITLLNQHLLVNIK